MDGFRKYRLLAFTAVTMATAANLGAQGKHRSTSKATSGDEQAKRASAPERVMREEAGKTFLHKDWRVQTSCEDKAGGEKISAVGFEAGGWHRADIPATVV